MPMIIDLWFSICKFFLFLTVCRQLKKASQSGRTKMQIWTMTLHPQNIVRYTRSYKNILCLLLQNINNDLNAACNNQWSGTASAENPSLTIRLGLWRVRSMRPIAHLESSQGEVEKFWWYHYPFDSTRAGNSFDLCQYQCLRTNQSSC